MTESEARDRSLELVEESEICLLGTTDTEGAPQIKAVIRAGHVGIGEVWISINTPSEPVAQIEKDPRVCLYVGQWTNEPCAG